MATNGKSRRQSGNSKPSSNGKKKAIDAPFDPVIIRKARKIAAGYRIIIDPKDEDNHYYGSTVEMPYVMGDGSTIKGCSEQVIEASVSVIATMLEAGERPPSPATDDKRDQQVNIRMTADERMRIKEAARQAGFRSVSDFIRTSALKASG